MVPLGDAEVEYDPGFKLYLATSLPNPHYLPEVCIKINLINFSVTQKVTRAGLTAATTPSAAPPRNTAPSFGSVALHLP